MTKDILHIAFSKGNRRQGDYNFTLEYVTRLLNLWFESTLAPHFCCVGMIVPTTKPGKRYSYKYGDKRPLTMTNCIAKIAMSALAERWKKILSNNKVLSNFAYLQNSSIDDCHKVFITALEECRRKDSPLLSLAYDQSKAFDGIQHWHVRLSLERLGIPKQFISFVMNYLKNSVSYIRTGYGLTNPIMLQNSVRQGDPLAPYLYICAIDGIFELVKSQTGVEISLESSCLAYADDIKAFSRNPSKLLEIHNCICSFFQIHTLVLNKKKTIARQYNFDDNRDTFDESDSFILDGEKLDFP